jgi:trehalose synthase
MTLDHYASIAYLAGAVHDLREEAASVLPRFRGRSVLMLNSAATGGGVAEMLPRMVLMLNELGITANWAAIKTDRAEFFRMTKRVHNLIHGQGDPALGPQDRELYEAVNRRVADALRPHLKAGDLLVVHDPQPMAAGAMLRRELDIRAIWRCHIGLDEDLPATRAAWAFLQRYGEVYDHSIFSAPEYVPHYLAGRASVIHPGIDPCSHKNRDLTPHKLTGILCNAGLAKEHGPLLTPPFPQQARRLQADGTFAPATLPEEIGFLYRPLVVELSRWDKLKGFRPLLAAFVRLKQRLREPAALMEPRHRRRLEILRLVLAGPDPNSIQDDPEALEELELVSRDYCVLAPEFQKDIAVLTLPLDSRKNNELTINALQRCATVVAQNSLREGFGLTVTEAMWKAKPVLGTEACGIRQQIRDGIDGRLVRNPEDPDQIAYRLDELLADNLERDRLGRNAQKRVYTEFLIFTQMQQLLRVLADCAQPVHPDRIAAPARPALAQV